MITSLIKEVRGIATGDKAYTLPIAAFVRWLSIVVAGCLVVRTSSLFTGTNFDCFGDKVGIPDSHLNHLCLRATFLEGDAAELRDELNQSTVNLAYYSWMNFILFAHLLICQLVGILVRCTEHRTIDQLLAKLKEEGVEGMVEYLMEIRPHLSRYGLKVMGLEAVCFGTTGFHFFLLSMTMGLSYGQLVTLPVRYFFRNFAEENFPSRIVCKVQLFSSSGVPTQRDAFCILGSNLLNSLITTCIVFSLLLFIFVFVSFSLFRALSLSKLFQKHVLLMACDVDCSLEAHFLSKHGFFFFMILMQIACVVSPFTFRLIVKRLYTRLVSGKSSPV